jgi:hypothetical protein
VVLECRLVVAPFLVIGLLVGDLRPSLAAVTFVERDSNVAAAARFDKAEVFVGFPNPIGRRLGVIAKPVFTFLERQDVRRDIDPKAREMVDIRRIPIAANQVYLVSHPAPRAGFVAHTVLMVDVSDLGQSGKTGGHPIAVVGMNKIGGHPIAVVGMNKIGPKIWIGEKHFRRIAEKTGDVWTDIGGSVETARAIGNGGPVFQHSRLVMPRVVVQTDQHAPTLHSMQTRSSKSPQRGVP